MKIELTSHGFDDALDIIEKDLKAALTAKTRKRKNELVYHALGAATTLYQLVMVREEAKETSTDTSQE